MANKLKNIAVPGDFFLVVSNYQKVGVTKIMF